MKNTSTRIPNSWYQPTPFGKLKAIPAFGLLNVMVLTAEADRLTNGEFELEVSLYLTAVVREVYDFPDFDQAAGEGVVLSVLPFLLNPDDYIRDRVGPRHVQAVLDAISGGQSTLAFDSSHLRDSGTPDILTQVSPRALPVYYKQRFLSCCCIGPKPLLDRLWLQPSPDILPQWVALLVKFLGWGDDVFVVPHPVLEPAGRAVAVGSANQHEWLHHQQEKFVTQAGLELVGFRKRPGSLPVAEYRPRAADGDERT